MIASIRDYFEKQQGEEKEENTVDNEEVVEEKTVVEESMDGEDEGVEAVVEVSVEEELVAEEAIAHETVALGEVADEVTAVVEEKTVDDKEVIEESMNKKGRKNTSENTSTLPLKEPELTELHWKAIQDFQVAYNDYEIKVKAQGSAKPKLKALCISREQREVIALAKGIKFKCLTPEIIYTYIEEIKPYADTAELPVEDNVSVPNNSSKGQTKEASNSQGIKRKQSTISEIQETHDMSKQNASSTPPSIIARKKTKTETTNKDTIILSESKSITHTSCTLYITGFVRPFTTKAVMVILYSCKNIYLSSIIMISL